MHLLIDLARITTLVAEPAALATRPKHACAASFGDQEPERSPLPPRRASRSVGGRAALSRTSAAQPDRRGRPRLLA